MKYLGKKTFLFGCFFLILGISHAQVTELPPIKRPAYTQEKPVSNIRGSSQAGTALNNGPTPSSKTPTGHRGEMAGLSAKDRALIAKACRPMQYRGPVAYHECEREQAEAARNSAQVSFIGVSDTDRSLIAKACRAKQHYGPAAFHSCERDQVETLKTSPAPLFVGVSSADRSMIAKACRSKQYSGPAAYRACQRDQVSQLQSSQATTSGNKQ